MNTEIFEELYRQIGNKICECIPEEWTKALVFSDMADGSGGLTFYYYYPKNNNTPVYNVDLISRLRPQIPKRLEKVDIESLRENTGDLFDLFSDLWEAFQEQNQEPWTTCTFILERSGKMNVDFGYEDTLKIPNDVIISQWKEKYLK